MRKLPLGIQTFSEIRKEDMVYVDKTAYVWKLVSTNKYHFLSRPRRFGKSLMVSTLESYFRGERELFRGLEISQHEKDWRVYPVVRIDLSKAKYLAEGELENGLRQIVLDQARMHQLTLSGSDSTLLFGDLLRQLARRDKNVVVLVDEYDKPLVNVLDIPEVFESNRMLLNSFYGILKAHDEHLRFVFLTGISRFSKVNVFSGLNNLLDISLAAEYAGIVGFSQQEVETNFPDYLERLATQFELSRSEMLENLRVRYNGYSWDGETSYYNPISLMNAFSTQKLDTYWFKTATPSFLYQSLVRDNIDPQELVNPGDFDLTGYARADGSVPIIPLLFQTGYLTIDRIERIDYDEFYHLRYPNQEVEQSFLTLSAAAFKDVDINDVGRSNFHIKRALLNGDLETVYRLTQAYLSDIPSRLRTERESYYHSMVYFLYRMLGMRLLLEKEMDRGRIDAVLEMAERVYIFEFKYGKPNTVKPETLSRRALKQIKTNHYARPYLDRGKTITLVGLGFTEGTLHGRHEIL